MSTPPPLVIPPTLPLSLPLILSGLLSLPPSASANTLLFIVILLISFSPSNKDHMSVCVVSVSWLG